MNSHEPSDKSEPPVSAWPDVHPRASRAATPIMRPPPKANARRTAADLSDGPRCTSGRKRPAVYAPNTPPSRTPSTSNTSQSSSTALPGPT